MKTELIKSNGEDEVINLSSPYETGSVKIVVTYPTGLSEKITNFQEISDTFILLPEAPERGSTIQVSYDEVGKEIVPSLSVIKRIKDLENEVSYLKVKNKEYEEALQNRLSVSTFQAWVRLIEGRLGEPLIKENLTAIADTLQRKGW